jgi:hypothetical protein
MAIGDKAAYPGHTAYVEKGKRGFLIAIGLKRGSIE